MTRVKGISFRNIVWLLVTVAGLYYFVVIPIVQLILVLIFGGGTAASVGLSLIVLRPASVFYDDRSFSIKDRILEYFGFSGGLIPFAISLSFAYFRSDLAWRRKVLLYLIMWLFAIVLMAACVTVAYGCVFGSLACCFGIAIGTRFSRKWGVT